ncbi:RNA-binding S4 domain-containing protein [Agarivorans sp. TSD2052]|uniref:RNA-binding S4 domain-containing protein n=1 Tax=Agarivorans sp. TSD2052 TaxID=2937286 RepID=UPI00200BEDB7|nr:RNA-binding S4 domain-containing protein [Agarivorans sp. TSD2052]UPW20232.1 RNA-binding S4 domain-containing protein [Agarivorans sp. TSD2052]
MSNTQDPEQEVEVEALEVLVNEQPIELYKVLKIGELVNGGGEAKMAIAEGYVGVNGEVEQRKRKKVYAGDIIEFNGQYLYVVCDQPVTDTSNKAVKPKTAKPKAKQKTQKESKPKPHSALTKPAMSEEPKRNVITGRQSIKF